jgi:hypothetical protein
LFLSYNNFRIGKDNESIKKYYNLLLKIIEELTDEELFESLRVMIQKRNAHDNRKIYDIDSDDLNNFGTVIDKDIDVLMFKENIKKKIFDAYKRLNDEVYSSYKKPNRLIIPERFKEKNIELPKHFASSRVGSEAFREPGSKSSSKTGSIASSEPGSYRSESPKTLTPIIEEGGKRTTKNRKTLRRKTRRRKTLRRKTMRRKTIHRKYKKTRY